MKKLILNIAFIFLIISFADGQILNKIQKFIKEEEIVDQLKNELINHLEESKKEYDATDYNYAVSFSDNSGLYENEEKYTRHKKLLLNVLKDESFQDKTLLLINH